MALSPTPFRATSQDGQLELSAGQARITQLAGAQQKFALSMRNNAGSPLSVEVSAKGPPGNWLSLDPTSVHLAPVQTAAVALTLTPPSEAPFGDYPLLILAQVSDHPETAVRLNLTLEIAEPGKLSVAVVPPQAEGQASAEFQVQVAQTGVEGLALGLSAKDEENACEYTFDPLNLVLQANGAATSRLVVRARQGLAGLDSRTIAFTVTAAATQGAAVIGNAAGRFVQRRALPMQLTLVPTEQRGSARVDYSVRLANGSQVQATVQLSAMDSQGACRFQFNPASLTLPPSGQAQATLTVVPLQSQSGTGEMIHTFTVRAEPKGELLAPVQVEGRFIQTAGAQPILTLRPPSQSKSGPATFLVQVKNPRTESLDLELRAYDANGACTFTVTPARLQIPPNGMATAQLVVRPTGALLPGEARRTNPFTVETRAVDLSEPSTIEGSLTLVRRSWLGLFLIGALAALLLGLFVAVVFVARSILTPSVPPTRTAIAIAVATASSTPVVVVILPTDTPQPVDTEVPIPPTDTAAPTVAPTVAPIPSITPSDTSVPDTPTLSPKPPSPRPRPSATTTPALPPGVYVTSLRVDPSPPNKSQPMTFFATFQNGTGAPQSYVYRVEIFRPDSLPPSLGVTSSVNVSVPVGVSVQQSGLYNVNACIPLRARVIWEGDHKKRNPFVKPDGSDFWFDFIVCG